MIPISRLEPDCFYWAKLRSDRGADVQIVKVSTVFGVEKEYWSIACVGSDGHRMPADFEFVAKIMPPSSKIKIAVEVAAE